MESDNNPGWVDGSISSERVDNVSVTFIKRLSSSLCIYGVVVWGCIGY